MKIGILTFHRAHNFGAVLQTLALKKVLEMQNHDVEIIDYFPKDHNKLYNIFHIKTKVSLLTRIKYYLQCLLVFIPYYQRKTKFNNFIRTQFSLSAKTKFLTASDINTNADIIIYGSDQIWNSMGKDNVYLGEYPKEPHIKITYAASIGHKVTGDETDFLKKYLNNFKHISAREPSLNNAITNYGFESKLVLDPTLLIEKKDWSSMFPYIDKSFKEKYIVLYDILGNNNAKDIAFEIAKKTNSKLITIRALVNYYYTKDKTIKQNIGPIDFLRLLNNAEFVVSSSFHGVAFSIIFEKQFCASLNKKSERVTALLEKINLQNRFINNHNYDINLLLSDKIDFHKHKTILKTEIRNSLDFLNNCLYYN